MKNLNTQLSILLAAMALAGVGCSKSSSNSDSSAVAVTPVAAVVAPAGLGGSTGTTKASFVPVSLDEMNAYVGSYPLNSPTKYKLDVQLTNVGKSRYAGFVTLSFYDVDSLGNRVLHSSTLKSCFSSDCKNPDFSSYGTARDVGDSEAKYNYWFDKDGKRVFSGFFQDQYGSIMLVIDNAVNLGDGQSGGVVSGQIWYRNFAQSFAYQSNLRTCWFIYNGPYDCRSDYGMNKKNLYPSDTYRKLGTFSGLTLTVNK